MSKYNHLIITCLSFLQRLGNGLRTLKTIAELRWACGRVSHLFQVNSSCPRCSDKSYLIQGLSKSCMCEHLLLFIITCRSRQYGFNFFSHLQLENIFMPSKIRIRDHPLKWFRTKALDHSAKMPVYQHTSLIFTFQEYN